MGGRYDKQWQWGGREEGCEHARSHEGLGLQSQHGEQPRKSSSRRHPLLLST